MTMRFVIFLVLLWNLLAVGAAVIIYIYTGTNHFKESGFITILSTFQLLAISRLSYKILQSRNVQPRCSLWRVPSAIWGLMSLGFIFLAADELFRIHENIDRMIHYIFNLQETGLTDRIDDVLIGLYGLVGIAILFVYRNELKAFKEFLPFFACGFVLLFSMVGLDVLTNRNDILPLLFDPDQAIVLHVWFSHAEDALKVFAEAFFILAFYAVLQKAKQVKEENLEAQQVVK